jgi:hypothetical protein
LDIKIANPSKDFLYEESNLAYILVVDNAYSFIYYANSHIYYYEDTIVADVGNIMGTKG